LIDENGVQLGVVNSREAFSLARERGYDLVAVAPSSNPPVCKLVDLGKYIYEQNKREKEARRKQTKVEIKQMRYKLKIDSNDISIKNKKVREFIEDGNRVNIQLWFRGRELAYPDKGFELADKIIQALSDIAIVSFKPKMEGRNMIFSLEPNKETLKRFKERRGKDVKKNENEQVSSKKI
jgi:translation initiation factor IF-3